jgi:hypothetical protein
MSDQLKDNSTGSQPRLVLVWKQFVKFLSHPITALVLGLLVALIFFLVAQSTKEPVFAVDGPQSVAQTVNEEARLRLFWERRN